MGAVGWPARVMEAERALSQGDARTAAALTASAALDPAAPVDAVRLEARALLALGRRQAACGPLRRLAEFHPTSAIAEHNLAATLGDAGDAQGSHDAARRALAKGGDAPETWLVLARALMSLSRLDEAEQAFRESLARRPLAPDTLRDLTQLIWMRDADPAKALSALDTALTSSAGSEELAAMRGQVAREIIGDRAAHEGMQPFLGRSHGAALALAAYAAAAEFDPAQALRHARHAVQTAPEDPACRTTLFAALLAAGLAEEALTGLDAFLLRWPLDQYGHALRLTAWRVLGDRRALTTEDYRRLTSAQDLATPAGRDRSAWLAEAAEGLRSLHPFRAEPLGQSIRSGVQAALDPRFSGHPAVEAVFDALPPPIEAYISAMSGQDDPMSRRAGSGFEIVGAWSVRLTAGGRHSDHVHPRGWISSALYVQTPEPTSDQPRAGWLRFGACRLGVGLELPAEHWIEPARGRVALFPSWMWHGTEPFTGGGERLTVAFDVQPR
jgi:tetratricopeptide (TPR) repeat protein